MSAIQRALSAVRRGRVQAEIAQQSGLPADLISLMIHESLGASIDSGNRPAGVRETGCAPVGCKGCFFAPACPSVQDIKVEPSNAVK